MSKRSLVVFLLLLLAAVVQIAPRLGKNSPKSVKINLHRGEPTTPVPPVKFYGYETGGWDVGYHIGPSGLYRGTFWMARTSALNRRGLAPYLYSLVSTFVHPYLAAILVNGFFYYLIIAAGFLLARRLKLPGAVAAGFAILLSANHFLLLQTIAPYFYIQYLAFITIVLLLLIELRIFEDPGRIGVQLLFGSVLACCGLLYSPFVFAAIILMWGLFHLASVIAQDRKRALVAGAQAAGLAALPFCSQAAWEAILGAYGLAGSSLNTRIRADLLSKIAELPKAVFSNFVETAKAAAEVLFKLVIVNPIAPNPDGVENLDPRIEYWAVLGVIGVVSFFFLLPRYLDRPHRNGLYACYLANLLLPFVASMAATVDPPMEYHYIFHSAVRTNHAYPVLVLCQSIGLYHGIGFLCSKLKIGRSDGIFFGVCACIYFLSFWRLMS